MRVRELIEELSKMDQELPVVVDTLQNGPFTIASQKDNGVSFGGLGREFDYINCIWLSLAVYRKEIKSASALFFC